MFRASLSIFVFLRSDGLRKYELESRRKVLRQEVDEGVDAQLGKIICTLPSARVLSRSVAYRIDLQALLPGLSLQAVLSHL